MGQAAAGGWLADPRCLRGSTQPGPSSYRIPVFPLQGMEWRYRAPARRQIDLMRSPWSSRRAVVPAAGGSARDSPQLQELPRSGGLCPPAPGGPQPAVGPGCLAAGFSAGETLALRCHLPVPVPLRASLTATTRPICRTTASQKTLHRQNQSQFQGKEHIPCAATVQDGKHGRDTIGVLRAKEAPEQIRENWPGCSWIIERSSTTVTRESKRAVHALSFIATVQTAPEALLRLIRRCWSMENEWHWARHAQLGEDGHRYANRNGVLLLSFLRSVVMNLLPRGGYRWIRQGLRALAYDISEILTLGGVAIELSTA